MRTVSAPDAGVAGGPVVLRIASASRRCVGAAWLLGAGVSSVSSAAICAFRARAHAGLAVDVAGQHFDQHVERGVERVEHRRQQHGLPVLEADKTRSSDWHRPFDVGQVDRARRSLEAVRFAKQRLDEARHLGCRRRTLEREQLGRHRAQMLLRLDLEGREQAT
jgi:hypothetical protein